MEALLAQARGTATVGVMLWVGVLIGVLLVAGVVLMLVHRKLLGRGEDAAGDDGLMDSLRRLRDSGRMSKEEFEAAKKTIARRSVESMEARLEARRAETPEHDGKKRGPDHR
jgi:flagellar biosynthesis/type III secretory pathway M-ring protein FliF/YscJ